MKRSLLGCALLLGSVAASSPATAKVFFRVAPISLPPSQKTGIHDVVLAWPARDSLIVAQLRSQGYQVWLQCEAKDFASTATAAARMQAEGVIVRNAASSSAMEKVRSYTGARKHLALRFLISGGKQPQLKGRLVVERDGILQVSSPSTQPWLDTNLAAVRIAQAGYPESAAIIYDFRWETAAVPQGAWHPDAEDYALAIAESDAIRSDVIIDLPVALQKALNAADTEAWSLWKDVGSYLNFSAHASMAKVRVVASLGVVVDDDKASYEAINLLARHNLAFAAVRPSDLTPTRLGNWNSVAVFCSLKAEATTMLRDFAAKGGVVVFVNSHDEFPWHQIPPLRRESHTATYAIGAGQIVELGEPVIDPENFARDLRRLIGRERSSLTLWNSLTTLVTAYSDQDRQETTLYLVNYADQPDNVQVQVKGRFNNVRLESPEQKCCAPLQFVARDGFTEFTIPSVRIAARVHLDFDREGSARE